MHGQPARHARLCKARLWLHLQGARACLAGVHTYSPMSPRFAATPAAVPPLLPEGVRLRSYGLRTVPKTEPTDLTAVKAHLRGAETQAIRTRLK